MSIRSIRVGSARLTKAVLIVSAIGVSLLLLANAPQVKASMRAAGFVAQVLPGAPAKPSEWFTDPPERIEVSFPLRNGSGAADLYTPPGASKHSAILLFLGVNSAGRDDERVINLADALTRAGLIVLVPWSDRMTQSVVEPQEVDDLVHAFQYLHSLDIVDGNSVGIAGFSVGASLAIVAAHDERIRDDIDVLVSLGGYYDAIDLIAAVAAQRSSYDGVVEHWQPASLSVRVVHRRLLDTIPDIVERDKVRRAIEDASPLPSDISDEALIVYNLLTAADLDAAYRHIDRLPPQELARLHAISPSHTDGKLSAKLLLMHDHGDRLVPSGESKRLYDAWRSDADIHYTEFTLFDHVEPSRSVSRLEYVKESAKLMLQIYRLMRELD